MFDLRKYYYLWPVALLGFLILLGVAGYRTTQSESAQRLWQNVNFIMTYDEVSQIPVPDSLHDNPEGEEAWKLQQFENTLNYPVAKVDSLSVLFKEVYNLDSLGMQWQDISIRLAAADTLSKEIAQRLVELDKLSKASLDTAKMEDRLKSLEALVKDMQKALNSIPGLSINPEPN